MHFCESTFLLFKTTTKAAHSYKKYYLNTIKLVTDLCRQINLTVDEDERPLFQDNLDKPVPER